MEDISELLFNLGSNDRLTLLEDISKHKQKLTSLAKVISASPQECSRHLTRLTDAGFVAKDSKGLYEITSFGIVIMAQLPNFQFLSRQKEYFLSHDLSFIPESFVKRIGELSGVDYVGHVSLIIELIKSVISTGRDYVWLISDQPIVVGGTIGSSFSPNVRLRLVGEQSVDPKLFSGVKSAVPNSELGTLPEVTIAMAINESIAGVCFPAVGGKIDFSAGFAGKDAKFRGWCCDLFEYYWSKSRKVTNFYPTGLNDKPE